MKCFFIIILTFILSDYQISAGGYYRETEFISIELHPIAMTVPIDSVSLNIVFNHVDDDVNQSSKIISDYLKQAKSISKTHKLELYTPSLTSSLSAREKDGLIFSSKSHTQYSMPSKVQFQFTYNIDDSKLDYFKICASLNKAIQEFKVHKGTTVKLGQIHTGVHDELSIHLKLIDVFNVKFKEVIDKADNNLHITVSGLDTLRARQHSPMSRSYFLDVKFDAKLK